MTAPLAAPLALALVALALLAPAQAGVTTQEICQSHSDCPAELSCLSGLCRDPCVSSCNVQPQCNVVNHQATCSFSWIPPAECEGPKVPPPPECSVDDDCPMDEACMDGKCVETCVGKCGPNAECFSLNNVFYCQCLPGFHGNPILGCVNIECDSSSECSLDSECVENTCVDACKGKCGNNTSCHVTNHFHTCKCLDGFEGSPKTGCTRPDHPSVPQIPNIPTPPPNTKRVKKYYIHPKSGDWQKAVALCHQNCSDLATVFNIHENQQVLALIKASKIERGTFWIGGTDQAKEGSWIWESLAEPIKGYSYWAAGKPNNFVNQDCLSYHESALPLLKRPGYFWNDKSCFINANVICEYYKWE